MSCSIVVDMFGSVVSNRPATFPIPSHTNNSKTINTTVNLISLFKPARKPTRADNTNIPSTASENISIKSLTFGINTPLSLVYSLIVPKKWLIGKQIYHISIFFRKSRGKCNNREILGVIFNSNLNRKFSLIQKELFYMTFYVDLY